MRLIRKKTNLKNLNKSLSSLTNKVHSILSNKKRVKSYYKTTYKIPNKIKRNTCITYTTPKPSVPTLSPFSSTSSSFFSPYSSPFISNSSSIPSLSFLSSSFNSSSFSSKNPIIQNNSNISFLSSNSSSKFKYKYVYDIRCSSNFKNASSTKKVDFIKKKERTKIFPNIFIENFYLCVDYLKVNLKKYPTTLKLIKAFFINEAITELTRENLIKQVYDEARFSGISKREECLSSNLIKLISRTRTLIKEAMTEEYKYIDWLYYDSTNKKWFLYTLQKEFIDIKESKFKNLIFNINTLNYYNYVNNMI